MRNTPRSGLGTPLHVFTVPLPSIRAPLGDEWKRTNDAEPKTGDPRNSGIRYPDPSAPSDQSNRIPVFYGCNDISTCARSHAKTKFDCPSATIISHSRFRDLVDRSCSSSALFSVGWTFDEYCDAYQEHPYWKHERNPPNDSNAQQERGPQTIAEERNPTWNDCGF